MSHCHENQNFIIAFSTSTGDLTIAIVKEWIIYVNIITAIETINSLGASLSSKWKIPPFLKLKASPLGKLAPETQTSRHSRISKCHFQPATFTSTTQSAKLCFLDPKRF